MQTISDIFSALGGPAAVGRIIGVSTEHAAGMRRRGAIPPAYWPDLVAYARGRGLQHITHEALTAIYAQRRPDRVEVERRAS